MIYIKEVSKHFYVHFTADRGEIGLVLYHTDSRESAYQFIDDFRKTADRCTDKLIAEEREACAQIADSEKEDWINVNEKASAYACKLVAKAIRNRGKSEK